MPTTAYLAGADTNDVEMSYGVETAYGVSPTGAYQKTRVNSESFGEDKTRMRPPELRSDGQAAAGVTTDIKASGQVQFGVSYGNSDDLIAASLNGAWAAPLAIVGAAADISAVVTTNKITSTTAGKFTNIVLGQWIKLSGFTNAANNGYARVTTKTSAQDITISGLTLVSETPTGTNAKIDGSILRNATTVNTFTMQKRFASGLGFSYPGSYFTGGQLNAQRGQPFSGQLSAISQAQVKQAAALGSGFTAAPTYPVMNTVGHFQGITKNTVALASKIMGVTIDYNKEGADLAFALGSASGQGLASKGTLAVTGKLSAYFADYSLYDDYAAETQNLIAYRVKDGSGNTYVVTVPTAVLSKAGVVAGGPNQAVMAEFDIMADPDPITGCTLQIDRL